MFSSEENTSSEEELLNIVSLLPRNKLYRKRSSPFEQLDEVEFKERYRFKKENVVELFSIFELDKLSYPNNKNNPISPLNQLLITLRYYATGSFQQVLGDHFYVHKSSVCRIIPRITKIIAKKSKEYIAMPQNDEDMKSKVTEFYNIKRFPGVIGAIDCTHVKIQSPGGDNAELFRNRKGWLSINVQCVCDANLKIMDIVARWPGSVHDSTIFNSSLLRTQFEMGAFKKFWLLGDNGYSCKPYLLTPVLNPNNTAEERYNKAHIRTRNTIERAFGVMKRRFLCLSNGIRMKPEKAVEIIVAVAVLHNISLEINDPFSTTDDFPDIAIQPDVIADNDVIADKQPEEL